ncbi:hypothetical protein HPB47_016704, partial [Ixodes persulcatus]
MSSLAEIFANEFARKVSLPWDAPSAPEPHIASRTTTSIDNNFTLAELTFPLSRCRRRGAPGPDGITNQALKNLDTEHQP